MLRNMFGFNKKEKDYRVIYGIKARGEFTGSFEVLVSAKSGRHAMRKAKEMIEVEALKAFVHKKPQT